MVYILYTIFFLSCIALIASVLLQPGKTDAGALFTSNISNTAFNPRGTAGVLAKFSIGAAIVFMVSALFLSLPAFNDGVSVLSTTADTTNQSAPAVTDDANVSLSTNANSAVQVDANNASNAIIVTNSNSVNAVITNTNTSANSAANANNVQGTGNANK